MILLTSDNTTGRPICSPANHTSRKSHLPFLTHEVHNNNRETNLLPVLHCVELNFPTHSHLTVIKKSYLMAPKLLFMNSLMERRKPKDATDELAVVKAAAWAWYQHGSGSEGKATRESDVTRTRREPRPSRYKLEAMRMAKEAKEGSPIHNKKSLLDAYEVQSISRQLDSLIESSHNKLGNGGNSANASLDVGGRSMMKKKKKIRKGFWLRHAAVCGTGEDVVDSSASRDGRQSAKRVPAVNLVKRLPRANDAL